MLRTATLLIMALLAGGPVGALGCELWCSSAADQRRAVGCHDASPSVLQVPQIASTSGCHEAAAIPPFVTEARHTQSSPVTAPPAARFGYSWTAADDEMPAGGYVFNVQPPRPHASRTILRI